MRKKIVASVVRDGTGGGGRGAPRPDALADAEPLTSVPVEPYAFADPRTVRVAVTTGEPRPLVTQASGTVTASAAGCLAGGMRFFADIEVRAQADSEQQQRDDCTHSEPHEPARHGAESEPFDPALKAESSGHGLPDLLDPVDPDAPH